MYLALLGFDTQLSHCTPDFSRLTTKLCLVYSATWWSVRGILCPNVSFLCSSVALFCFCAPRWASSFSGILSYTWPSIILNTFLSMSLLKERNLYLEKFTPNPPFPWFTHPHRWWMTVWHTLDHSSFKKQDHCVTGHSPNPACPLSLWCILFPYNKSTWAGSHPSLPDTTLPPPHLPPSLPPSVLSLCSPEAECVREACVQGQS